MTDSGFRGLDIHPSLAKHSGEEKIYDFYASHSYPRGAYSGTFEHYLVQFGTHEPLAMHALPDFLFFYSPLFFSFKETTFSFRHLCDR